MKTQKNSLQKCISMTGVVALALSLSHCATQEVNHELAQQVESKGESFVAELAAQSPFEKVEMSWNEAYELMKTRNLSYRKAMIDKEDSLLRKGVIKNLTFEVRKSLQNSVQTTLNPSEIAKAMKNPMASLPRQLESITDLKNVSHSLTDSEWSRVSQSVQADKMKREEIVNLHALFCRSEILEKAEQKLKVAIHQVSSKSESSPPKAVSAEIKKARDVLQKDRGEWLQEVRDFFNAEYYNVKFSKYNNRLNFYRSVKDPGFSDWRRWRKLENSYSLAKELKKQHAEDKPRLPGLNMLISNLGVNDMRQKIVQDTVINEGMTKEVRDMLKGWRSLKAVQQKISQSGSQSNKESNVAKLKYVIASYKLKSKEVEHLKKFWIIDERCWNNVVY